MTDPHVHLDLDALADVLAGEAEAPGCATCAAALADLETASGAVAAALGDLPVPVLPADLAARLDAALLAARAEASGTAAQPTGAAAVTTLPSGEERATRASGPRRWLPAAAAAIVLAGGGLLAAQTLTLGSEDGADESATAAGDVAARDLVRNSSGNAYTQGNLAAAVPGILRGAVPELASAPMSAEGEASKDSAGDPPGRTGGTGGSSFSAPQAAGADPLAHLRTTDGLAACLAALLPPDDDSVQALALDYGTFDGVPALLVVLPVPDRADKVDVFVVGAGCALDDEELLFFQRVDRPA